MKLRHLTALLLATLGLAAVAKLPPPTEAEQAKAEETKAKAAWTAKVAAFQLCKVQDRVAAKFGGGKSVAQSPGAAQPPAATNSATKTAASPAPAAPATGTPVASSAPPPCMEPGPFAYTAPSEKPLEASGAHSPAGTAATPPSVRPEAVEMRPSQPAAAPGNKS